MKISIKEIHRPKYQRDRYTALGFLGFVLSGFFSEKIEQVWSKEC